MMVIGMVMMMSTMVMLGDDCMVVFDLWIRALFACFAFPGAWISIWADWMGLVILDNRQSLPRRHTSPRGLTPRLRCVSIDTQTTKGRYVDR